ncbi:S8 family serine peptidase [Candidatus Acetothermia bacterium]|jgi:subtilisin family serine protease|nr:S8 family serine peptidase [Candidatus Acetothermia bacterium]MCI2431079.1 S8 family serine peptidase [Candidatus Acetothermia bacterium]MCI2435703.1 S8 family serine peptidase [Candidatus Acetothermia bacterium]
MVRIRALLWLLGIGAIAFIANGSPRLWEIGALREPSSRATTSLETVLLRKKHADILVLLKEQADLSQAKNFSNQHERGRFVYDNLTQTAERSQRELRTYLDAKGVKYRAHYLVNMIAIPQADLGLLRALAQREDVARIELNPQIRNRLFQSERDTPSQTEILWNLKTINADQVWALGITGKGVVVGGADTGIDWQHAALLKRYRGFDGERADHNYNWHDAVDGTPEPIDPDGHGTITLGVVVGDDGERMRTGVAYEAQWMGCRNMEQGGFGTPERYIGCMEFFLAPYPIGGNPLKDGDPSKAPSVINNSWGCPPEEGCSPETLKEAVERVRAAGILFVAAAGNDGPNCRSMDTPPAIYSAAFTVGATNRNDEIARFSSRGPLSFFGEERIGPEVSAPGVGVRGPLPGNRYISASGTSLAAPHVAGVAALIFQAAPHLKGRVEIVEDLLRQTSLDRPGTDCGGDRPDNTYGWGRIDALAAVKAAIDRP